MGFKLDDLCEKLLRLALDPGAMEGEAKAAFLRLLFLARKDGASAQAIVELLRAKPVVVEKRVEVRVEVPVKPKGPDWWELVVIPFGRHKGQTIGVIARAFPGYVRWCNESLRDCDPDVKFAFECAEEWIDCGSV